MGVVTVPVLYVDGLRHSRSGTLSFSEFINALHKYKYIILYLKVVRNS